MKKGKNLRYNYKLVMTIIRHYKSSNNLAIEIQKLEIIARDYRVKKITHLYTGRLKSYSERNVCIGNGW